LFEAESDLAKTINRKEESVVENRFAGKSNSTENQGSELSVALAERAYDNPNSNTFQDSCRQP
jgi:hypothetical protein